MKLLIALVCSATVAQARKMFEGNLWKFLEPESDTQFKVVDIYQRERPSFLQGIEYLGDDLFIESSGMYGESETSYSSIDGNVIKAESTVPMDDSIFGEGICTLPGAKSFLRLHWQDKIMDILDSSLKTIDSIPMFEGPA
jgi:glutamine cyclotransferase